MQRAASGDPGHDAPPARDAQRRSLLAAAELEREPLPAHSGMALSHAGGAPGVPPSGPGGGTRRWAAMRGGGGGARLGGLAWPRVGQPGAAAHGGNVSGAPAAAHGALLGVCLLRSGEASQLLHGAAGLTSANGMRIMQVAALTVRQCCVVGALELVRGARRLTGSRPWRALLAPTSLSRRCRTLAATATRLRPTRLASQRPSRACAAQRRAMEARAALYRTLDLSVSHGPPASRQARRARRRARRARARARPRPRARRPRSCTRCARARARSARRRASARRPTRPPPRPRSTRPAPSWGRSRAGSRRARAGCALLQPYPNPAHAGWPGAAALPACGTSRRGVRMRWRLPSALDRDPHGAEGRACSMPQAPAGGLAQRPGAARTLHPGAPWVQLRGSGKRQPAPLSHRADGGGLVWLGKCCGACFVWRAPA